MNTPQQTYPHAHTNTADIPAIHIDTIVIDWICGSVIVSPYDGDSIQLIEGSARELDEDKKFFCEVNGSTLTVSFQRKKMFWFFFHSPSKNLEVRVPKPLYNTLNLVKISTVSANSTIEGLTLDSLKVNTTSGKISVKNIQSSKISLNTTSGDVLLSQTKVNGDVSFETVSGNLSGAEISCGFLTAHSVSGDHDISGSMQRVKLESVSGALSIATPLCPNLVAMETVSGNMQLKTTEQKGFTAKLSSVSGNVSCSIPATMSHKNVVVGDGSSHVSFDSVSGDVFISAYNTVD